jgi:hypothetical protein
MKLNLAGSRDVSSRVKATLLFLAETDSLPRPPDQAPKR